MTFSRSIYVAANGIISFFFMAEWYAIVYIYHIFSIKGASYEGRSTVLSLRKFQGFEEVCAWNRDKDRTYL